MTDCETLSRRQDMVTLHVKEDETAGLGERDYVDHVSAQKLSAFERIVVVGALVLLSFAGFAAYSSGNTDPMTTSAIAAPPAITRRRIRLTAIAATAAPTLRGFANRKATA